MKRKTILAIVIFFIVQFFITGYYCKLSAESYALLRNLNAVSRGIENLEKDFETLFGYSNEEVNKDVKKLEDLNVYCTRSRIVELTHDLSPEYWIAHVEKHGYKQVEVKPEFAYCYRLGDSLFAYRWKYKDTITDYATLYICNNYYYFERKIK